MISGSYLVAGSRKVIIELADNIVLDFFLAAAGSGKEDRAGRCLRAFDTLGMIVCDLGSPSGNLNTYAMVSWRSVASFS